MTQLGSRRSSSCATNERGKRRSSKCEECEPEAVRTQRNLKQLSLREEEESGAPGKKPKSRAVEMVETAVSKTLTDLREENARLKTRAEAAEAANETLKAQIKRLQAGAGAHADNTWHETTDASGRTYWHHPATGESMWENPTSFSKVV